jgi:hypothetical protein
LYKRQFTTLAENTEILRRILAAGDRCSSFCSDFLFRPVMLKRLVKRAANAFGFDVVRAAEQYPHDMLADDIALVENVKPYTMTGVERIVCVRNAVKYIVGNNLRGDIVECGVWRGGSIMAILYTLLELGDTSRTIYLYDTFEGMTPPTEKDVDFTGTPVETLLEQTTRTKGNTIWAWATLDDVKQNVAKTGYPADRIHYVQGDVLKTIPATLPSGIALLRLDTDWYESTKHELVHLYPLLNQHGILIVDDYGHYKGARQAVDEYFAEQRHVPFLQRIDYTGRCLVKTV